MNLITSFLATPPEFFIIKVEFNFNAVAIFSFIRNTSSLFYYINKFTSLKYLYIP